MNFEGYPSRSAAKKINFEEQVEIRGKNLNIITQQIGERKYAGGWCLKAQERCLKMLYKVKRNRVEKNSYFGFEDPINHK